MAGAVFFPGVTIEREVFIPMGDGVSLCADIYRPAERGTNLPILLMRLPYGRDIASTVAYRHPSWYALQGYIVVIQEVRGCGRSGGQFYPFRSEYTDGKDTIDWCVRSIPENNGRVGMYGFSYQGVNQFQAAVMAPEGLVTICPGMASADLFDGWFYWGGALCWEFVFTWALQLAQIAATEPLKTELFQAQQNIPYLLRSVSPRNFPLLTTTAIGQFYVDWLNARKQEDWQALHPLAHFDRFDLPALHIGGWYDPFITGIWQTYQRACAVTSQPQKLIVGPWKHFPWRQRVGELDFGSAANRSVDEMQIDWFNFWLKDIDNGIAKNKTNLFFLMGENTWITTEPSTSIVVYYLNSDRSLTTVKPTSPHPNIYVYEPWNPTPSTDYAPVNQKNINDRWDCLTFYSGVLERELSIGGVAECWLEARTNAPDTDWVVKLLDVYSDDREILVTMGVLRASYGGKLPSQDQGCYRIPLRPTYHCFKPGHRLGVTVSSAAFPLIERHSNTASQPSTSVLSEWQASTQMIFPQSRLHLPVLV
ncbi:MAG: CocE/NonD family hydrolase [Cyanobacteria bacterium KgW148]|nr:CocE/NonD family hydrolase [Cyanobacteria bacterium KgW148]